MDEQGIHAAVMYPGHVLNLEYEFADDVDAIYANARAYNRWIHAEVGYGTRAGCSCRPTSRWPTSISRWRSSSA